jgi:putative DNA primase/helicase
MERKNGIYRTKDGECNMTSERQDEPNNATSYREQVLQRKAEAENRAQEEDDGPQEENFGLPSSFIRDCAEAGDMGDGMMYAAINKHIRINLLTDENFRYVGPYWKQDVEKEAYKATENVAKAYRWEAGVLSKEIGQAAQDQENDHRKRLEALRDRLNKKVDKMRSRRGQENALHFAQFCDGGLGISGFNGNPWILATENKIVDLKTGGAREGRKTDYVTKASPVQWQGIDAPAELWEKTLLEVFDGDQELVDFLRRLFGYTLIGKHLEDIFVVFSGSGRNGKSMIVEIVRHVLGSLAGPIPSELLLSQGKGRNSSGPSPDIMTLKGLRMAIASENDPNQRYSPSEIKKNTGGDTLVGRNPHDKYLTAFEPTHTLFLLTNHKPHAPADDFAFWERVLLVPFELSFVDREPSHANERRQDKHLKQKLLDEASGILAWMVRGCLEYQAQGLNPPNKVKQATAEYRREEDILADWIDECAVVWEDPESHSTSANRLYESFSDWMKEQGVKPWSSTAFGRAMRKKFEKKKVKGTYYYKGVSLRA